MQLRGKDWYTNLNWESREVTFFSDPCDNKWYGVTCENGKIIEINLSNNKWVTPARLPLPCCACRSAARLLIRCCMSVYCVPLVHVTSSRAPRRAQWTAVTRVPVVL